jgi:HAD superfamily hydrolase (TIGR01549 family)
LKLSNIDGVIFDLDGTLVDLGAHVDWDKVQQEIRQLYASHGLDLSEVEKLDNINFLNLLEKTYELLTFKGEEKARLIENEAYNLVCDYEREACYSCVLMDGSKEILTLLDKNNLKIGLCTSNSQRSAEKVLKYHNIHKFFGAIVGRTTKYKMKPCPDQLKECLNLLNIRPERSVMVGDSHKDVLAGKALGTFTIAIPMYFSRIDKIIEAKVDKIIENLHELPYALISL